ncbi:MAG: hypothetical protein L3J33_00540 [Rhodobacteraceae bacterium]|nr:hypothetical protein [Paracoccaceae bacterium]
MRYVSFGLLGLAAIAISGCDIEAGSSVNFPPIGGVQQPVYQSPDTFMPEPQAPSEQDMTASLTDAVDAALAATNDVNAVVPVTPVANVQIDPVTGETIASDDGVLNLAEQSQAEQLVLRNADAAALAAAAAQRVVIAPGEMPEVIAGVNIIAYARSTTNVVGNRIIRRPAIRRTNNRAQCAKFDTQDNAQRNFLANGGPQEDPLNLDPDGDGFACRWSPDAYRALNLN